MVERGSHRVDRVRLTFVPTSDEASFENVPSTFSPSSRTYAWKRASKIEYLIVPKKISSNQVVVELYVEPGKGVDSAEDVQKAIEALVDTKIQTEWRGLKLSGIRKAGTAVPPERPFVRGTIEEILGSKLGKE